LIGLRRRQVISENEFVSDDYYGDQGHGTVKKRATSSFGDPRPGFIEKVIQDDEPTLANGLGRKAKITPCNLRRMATVDGEEPGP